MDASEASERIHRKAIEILRDPPKFDKYGRAVDRDWTYRDAVNAAMEEMPEETAAFLETYLPARARRAEMPALITSRRGSLDAEEAAERLHQRTLKIIADSRVACKDGRPGREIGYGDALSLAGGEMREESEILLASLDLLRKPDGRQTLLSKVRLFLPAEGRTEKVDQR